MGLIGLFALLLFLEFPGSWLMDPDETRYAEIPREMLATGDYVTPRLNGSVYFEKPPMLYWLNAGSMALLGETPFAARLPTRLATLGTAFLLLFLVTSSATPNAGLWAALIFLSAPLSFALGRINLTDGVLTFFMTWSFLALRAYLRRIDAAQRTWPIELALGTGVGLAVLTKGLIGILFPVMALIVWAAIHKKFNTIPRLLFSWAPVVFWAICLPWFSAVAKANPGFLDFFFIHEHFLRYATKVAARPGPPYYFIVAFLLGFLPWTLLFLNAVRPYLRLQRSMWRDHMDESFFLIWFLSILVVFSLSRSKLIPYILPAIPAAAVLVGHSLATNAGLRIPWRVQAPVYLVVAVVIAAASAMESGFFGAAGLRAHAVAIAFLLVGSAWLGNFISQDHPFGGHAAHLFSWAGIYFVLALALPRLADYYSDQNLAVIARQTPSDVNVCYETFSNSFPWVQKAYVPVAKYDGEFPSLGERSPVLFWNHDDFFSRWNSSERLVVVIRKRSLDHFASSARKPFVLATSRRSALIANFDARSKNKTAANAGTPSASVVETPFERETVSELIRASDDDHAAGVVVSSAPPAGSDVSLVPPPVSVVSVIDFNVDDAPKRFLMSRGTRNALVLIGALAVIGSQDQTLQKKFPRFLSHTFGEWSPESFGERGNIERFGRLPGAAQVAGGFYVAGALTGSVTARRVGVLALEAKLANDLVTRSFKHAIGRERPGSTSSDGDEFKPFGSADSFPSGHTSSAFALATVVADNYESKWVKFASYGLAMAVGLGRINQGAHWASDVAGGALVGIGVGKLISGLERRKGWSRALYFEGNGVSVKKRFQ